MEFFICRAGLVNRPVVIALFAVACAVGFFKFKGFSRKIGFVSMYQLRGPLSDYKVDQGPQIDKCLSRSQCVLMYVAPWCPACHQFLNDYQMIKTQLDLRNVGTLIIVGGDEIRAKEIDMKEELGAEAILDTPLNDFRTKNHIDMFPYFVVTNAKGEVFVQGNPDGFAYINKKMNE